MEHKYSEKVDWANYDPEDLCQGMIDLRRHVAGDLEEIGAFRAQEDWRRLVGPLENPFRGGLGGDQSFITISVPECLPERLEITSYGLEFGFIHDDVIDQNIEAAGLDEFEEALKLGSETGVITERKGASGKRIIAAQIMKEMMAIDPKRAMALAKHWAAGTSDMNRRVDDTNFKTLEQYIPYRAFDVGYKLWHGLVLFGCALTIPDEDADQVHELLIPALITASLTNDLFSFEKERNDANVQNAVLVVMNEHNIPEEEAREILRKRIRIECANYVKNVKETWANPNLSLDTKKYIDVIQYTLSGNFAWSTQCPRYHPIANWNDLQMKRAKDGVAKHPATYKLEKTETKAPTELTESRIKKHSAALPKVNGTSRSRKSSQSGSETDSLNLDNLLALAVEWNLPDLSDNVVLQPYKYLTSLPSKGFRDRAIDSLNTWLKVPEKSADIIKDVVSKLHSASLMLDDLEDGSPLRRGKPSTHNIFGTAQTINSATFQYTKATAQAAKLSPHCLDVFLEETESLYVGQSYDLYWTHNTLCPSVSQYLKMIDKKTGALFRMLSRMMIAESPLSDKIADEDLNLLSCLIGRFFQIRDDYQNLSDAEYTKQKGYAEDLDEGKYSLILIHCHQTLESDDRYAGDMMQLRSFLMKRRLEGKLSNEAKREVMETMKKTNSLEYTHDVLKELHIELTKEVGNLEAKFGEENFMLRLMLEMLKV